MEVGKHLKAADRHLRHAEHRSALACTYLPGDRVMGKGREGVRGWKREGRRKDGTVDGILEMD